ncbi:MAG: TonB-dependent receptor, partial [Sphingomonas sp.]|uniref:TonB-dependent receptor n=1 Tax=Sphingomonas sp. TaxID=28214 RepID=UPI003F3CDF38
ALMILVAPLPAQAQENPGQQEVIVTGMRRDIDGYEAGMPAVGLQRRADFAVQQITINGDTRDADKRREEIYAMVRAALMIAPKRGVELAQGDTVVEPLTLDNYTSLSLKKDSRPDADKVSFLVKTPLGPNVDLRAAEARIAAFVKAVPPVGRALMETSDEIALSVVRPDQYRGEIIAKVADDARFMAAKFGDGYAVEAQGVERPVEWARASLTDVLLYIPYKLTVVPKR